MRLSYLGEIRSRVQSETAITVLCNYRKHSPTSAGRRVGSVESFTNSSRRE